MTTTFAKQLEALDACAGAREWAGKKSLATAWAQCPRGDWMLWLAAKAGVERRLIVEAACRCAEAVIGFVPEGEDRPIRAIEAARAWIQGEATIEQVRAAADATCAADAARATCAAARATCAAAADAAAYAAYAAYAAAAYAADAAAAYAAAREEALADCADLVRQVITAQDVAAALKCF